MLILRTLVFGELHGYGIAQFIRQPRMSPCSLKRARSIQLSSAWNSRRSSRPSGKFPKPAAAPVSKLTKAGKQKLAATVSRWEEFVSAIGLILHAPEEQAK